VLQDLRNGRTAKSATPAATQLFHSNFSNFSRRMIRRRYPAACANSKRKQIKRGMARMLHLHRLAQVSADL
jgi:hypothetical protein